MERRHFLKSFGACSASVAFTQSAIAQPKQPNIVFILSDDQGWTGLSLQVHDGIPNSKSDFYQTPNTERLATQGIQFTDAYAPAPMCTPTRASLLTGKSPAQLHITTPGPGAAQPKKQRVIPPIHHTILSDVTHADLLKKAGYATAHFGKWHLGGGSPGEHGFDAHDGETANAGPGLNEDPNPKDIFGLTERGSAFMEKNVKSGTPFFLQLSHWAVHGPTLARESTKAKIAKRTPGKIHNNIDYAAMTEDLDTSVGMIMEKIDELGIADNTYLVYLSDNGAGNAAPGGQRGATAAGPPNNYPLAGGKSSLWEGGVRAPLIIRGPGIAKNLYSHTRVVGYDLFTTFCEWAGVKSLPQGVEGGSLVSLLENRGKGEVQRPHEGIAFHYPHYGRGPTSKPQSSYLLGDYKLLKTWDGNTLQLFNLAKDIGENNDLAQQMPDKLQDMHARLERYFADVGAQLPVENTAFDADVAREEMAERRTQQASGRRGQRGQRGQRGTGAEGERPAGRRQQPTGGQHRQP
jgi:arylsulfatase A